MQKPNEEIRAYLTKLINIYLFIVSLKNQLRILLKWENSDKIDIISMNIHFFTLVKYSFIRTIVIELNKLLDRREDKSILDFMNKVKENATSIRLNYQNHNSLLSEKQVKSEFDSIFNEFDRKLNDIKESILKLNSLRDKVFTHIQSNYFNNPEKIYEHFPLEIDEIESVSEVIEFVLKKFHLLFFDSDILLNVFSKSDLNDLLNSCYAFYKMSNDTELLNKGVIPNQYMNNS